MHRTDAQAAPTRTPDWRIGLVGFAYPEWTGPFYPSELADHRRFAWYAARHNAVEINTTFYGPPSPGTVKAWARTAPADFRFALKAPRDITHGPTPEGALANAAGPGPGHFNRPETLVILRRVLDNASVLGDRLGPILMQFPPAFTDAARTELTGYLDRIEPHLSGLRASAPNARLAVEFRHASWATAQTAAMLADRGMTLVHADHSTRSDSPEAMRLTPPHPIAVTSDILYLRFLGRHGQFRDRTREQLDPTARLARWKDRTADALGSHPAVRTVYAFFDNDYAGHAPATAARFAALVGARQPVLAETKPLGSPTLFEL
ncbi:MAG TPA: DUF72 domain-containing protein [Phycisphaerales bacterium]|nr:DUF72 domain-containing protein [Phycisphaerales bacterium]